MFKDCKSLSGVYNLQNVNTKYLREICGFFEGCNSLIYIDDISISKISMNFLSLSLA